MFWSSAKTEMWQTFVDFLLSDLFLKLFLFIEEPLA